MDIKLRNKILEEIKPNIEEQKKLEYMVLKFIKKLKRSSKKLDFNVKFQIGGSFGKNTYLKGTSDVDIFASFDKSYDSSSISNYLELILINLKLKYKKQKGSRDYFSIRYVYKKVKIIFEIVPNISISDISEQLNSTDASPLHVDFIKKKSNEIETLCDEIRLAKQYFKSKGLYGAESYINGFSGHVIDILISYYKTLQNLLDAGKTWDERVFIDISNFYLNESEALSQLDKEKLSNLILIDPILKTRNAARALSNENFSKFIMVCNEFVDFKEEDFMIIKPNFKTVLNNASVFAKQNNLILLSYKFRFKLFDESEDIVGSKLLKLFKKTRFFFESYDFSIFNDDFFIDVKNSVCLMIYLIEKRDLPNVKKVIGPKVFMVDAVKSFLEKREYYFIEDSRVCSYENRPNYKLKEISKLDLIDFAKLLNKNFDFAKSVQRKLN